MLSLRVAFFIAIRMNLFYREKGNPEHPPLIILHGLWGASDNWLQVANLLTDHFHVILPDLRNHGHSPHDPDHSYETLSKDIITFIHQLNLPVKPFIAGHSMGGKALMLALLKRLEIAEKVAIIDICPGIYETAYHDIHLRLLNFAINTPLQIYNNREEIHARIRNHFASDELCQILFKNLRKTFRGFEWKINVRAIQNHLPELMSWPAHPTSGIYPLPILFVKGEYSVYIKTGDLTTIQSFFPAAIVTLIPGATHHIHADSPLLLAQALTHFFIND